MTPISSQKSQTDENQSNDDDTKDSITLNTTETETNKTNDNMTDDNARLGNEFREMRTLEERRRSLLDHHWAVPSKERYYNYISTKLSKDKENKISLKHFPADPWKMKASKKHPIQ